MEAYTTRVQRVHKMQPIISWFKQISNKLEKNYYNSMKFNEKVPCKANFINPCLNLEEEENDDMDTKTDYIKYTLKVKTMATGTNMEKYQIYIKRFGKGSPREFITMQMALAEIHI